MLSTVARFPFVITFLFYFKELTRELRVTKKRLDQLENSSTIANTTQNNDEASLGSRTSSNTSINTTGIVRIKFH